MTEHEYGPPEAGPIDPKLIEMMNMAMRVLDKSFNGKIGGPGRAIGLVLLVFPYGEADRTSRSTWPTTSACNVVTQTAVYTAA
jgi:hypothetical protein